jgi:hypothetical protein
MSKPQIRKAASDTVPPDAVERNGQSFLIQILLPTHYNTGRRIPDEAVETVKAKLVEHFGGVTAFTRSPAKGVWTPEKGPDVHEDVVIVEVMTEALDEAWWRQFRQKLEHDLQSGGDCCARPGHKIFIGGKTRGLVATNSAG